MVAETGKGSGGGKSSLKFLRRGKVKEIYEVSDEVLEFRFTDDISVFDKKIPSPIPHKGETLARTSAHWFRMCSRLGIRHHFLELMDGNRMQVRRVDVSADMAHHAKKSVLIPLEFIVRYYVAGTLWDRIQKGKTHPGELGLPAHHTITYGEKLPTPHFEMTTKLEHIDRLLSEKEAMEIGGITRKQVNEIQEVILSVDRGIEKDIHPRGLIHVDGKKEFAFDAEGQVMIVDTFGTGDEDRFWDTKEMERGRFEDFSKEFVRQYYRKSGYHEQLMKAREHGGEEPPIPGLPPQMVEEVSKMYRSIYERLTGEPFRPVRSA
ncbi:MAG: phosphoribosylaminoimidazolesuccinocarboxamide synthase [Candidatus Thermoplasmatota archaeon]|nr:phosphoribosylaminoimidazolesuccinocarboxamide synthase [Candidatus Thermoplasmatota archaeon]MCL5984671.1 phosphoribosylaminoimidazolesuccinocarboxamide synthase [Candidatus Thermoplasmatota archaeon]